jgi:hypothetical protein
MATAIYTKSLVELQHATWVIFERQSSMTYTKDGSFDLDSADMIMIMIMINS